jgi:hypothetical protein
MRVTTPYTHFRLAHPRNSLKWIAGVYKENPLRTNEPTFSFVIYNCRSGPLHRICYSWRSLRGSGMGLERSATAVGKLVVTTPPGIESTLHHPRRSLRHLGSSPCCIAVADHCAARDPVHVASLITARATRDPVHVASPITAPPGLPSTLHRL